MTNLYPGLARGPIDHKSSSVINMIANAANMEMGGCVKLVAPPSTELLPRATPTTAEGELSYGIIVGGDNDGIYGDGGASPADNTTKASLLAGDGIVVCTQGRCLARLAENCTLGARLGASNAGALVLANAVGDEVLAVALQVGSAGDVIAVDVQRQGPWGVA